MPQSGSASGRRPRRRLTAAVTGLAFLAILGLLWFGLGLSPVHSGPPGPGPADSHPDPPDLPEPVLPGRPLNVLVLGVDAGQKRTDVIFIAHWEPESGVLNLVSLPRDTRVDIPCPAEMRTCTSPDKLGHAHAYGESENQGPALARATAEQLLGIRIDYHVRITFAGFQKAIGALGGITLDVEPGLESIGLAPGRQTLDSWHALRYVRFRSDGRGDIGRIERTHRFMEALLAAARRTENRNRLPGLALALLPEVTTDLDAASMLGLIVDLTRASDLHLDTALLPGEELWQNNLWYWAPDAQRLPALVQRYLTEGAAPTDETGQP